MVVTPVLAPVTVPESEPIAATEGKLLVQVPPGVILVSVVEDVPQMMNVPAMADGNGFTVTSAVA